MSVFMKAFFSHPDRRYGWSEKFYITGAANLSAAAPTANIILPTLCRLKAEGVILEYAYVSADDVFRDRLYLDPPDIITTSGTVKIYNSDLLVDGVPATPETSAHVLYSNQDGTSHGRMFLRGLPDRFFTTYPDKGFGPSGGWLKAWGQFVRAIGASGTDGGARLSFSVIDKTQSRIPITAGTNVGNLVSLTLDGNLAPAGDAIYIGKTKGAGLNINKVWQPGQYSQVNPTNVSIQLPAPGFTWRSGGYAMVHSRSLAAIARISYDTENFVSHDTGSGIAVHKGRGRKRTPQITF